MKRHFLNWDRPLLHSAVDWLATQWRSASEWNLKEVIVVLPVSRAGRRLLELLVLRAELDKVWLTPPRIITLGELPELLYPLQRPLANDLVQQLTWAKVLREIDPGVLGQISPHPPERNDSLAWWAFATLLWNQHRELAAEGLDFSHVVTRCRDMPGFTESARWEAMRQVQIAYLRELDTLDLWDAQTARLVALEKREPQTSNNIVLVGTVDMNQALRQMLDLVADRVTALIGAPEDQSTRFDSYGCLAANVWNSATTDVPDECIRVCGGPAEQARQVARELAAFDGRFRADEVVVGLADSQLAPFVERELNAWGVPTRWIEGHDIARSGPFALLNVVAELLDRNRFDDFASLVRHPDLVGWLSSHKRVSLDLSALDELFRQHLPISPDVLQRMLAQPMADSDSMLIPRKRPRRRRSKPSSSGERLLFPDSQSPQDSLSPEDGTAKAEDESDLAVESVLSLLAAVGELLTPLRGGDRGLNAWGEPLLAWLRQVYGERMADDSTDAGRILSTALRKLREAGEELISIPPSIAPKVSAADAIRCLIKRASGECVPPEPSPHAVELLGWLELALDDSPAAIVTSVNEGFVPTSLNSDLFLPNELRRRLKLHDNDRRYARDAYAIAVLQHSRRNVLWLVGQRDKEGNPQFPSRLLLAVDPDQLPQRVLRFLEHDDVEDSPLNATTSANESGESPTSSRSVECGDDEHSIDVVPATNWTVPTPSQIVALIARPELLQPVREVRLKATEFKSYLACPYRYFLRDVLNLRSSDDDAVEMDAPAFGSVLHEVLRRFGKSAARDSSDEETLCRELLRSLDAVALEQFGPRRRAAVNVQLAQVEGRLEAFARWQAQWRRDGWRIEHIEQMVEPNEEHPPHLKSPRVSLWLRGRIDRIDRHEQSGEWAVLDYKSGDQGDSPVQTHQKKTAWIDLQLPMYRHLTKTLALPGQIRLGYIVLPRDMNAVGVRLAEWSAEDLDAADQAAISVAELIADRIFWPATSNLKSPFDEFAAICQVGVFGANPSVP